MCVSFLYKSRETRFKHPFELMSFDQLIGGIDGTRCRRIGCIG